MTMVDRRDSEERLGCFTLTEFDFRQIYYCAS